MHARLLIYILSESFERVVGSVCICVVWSCDLWPEYLTSDHGCGWSEGLHGSIGVHSIRKESVHQGKTKKFRWAGLRMWSRVNPALGEEYFDPIKASLRLWFMKSHVSKNDNLPKWIWKASLWFTCVKEIGKIPFWAKAELGVAMVCTTLCVFLQLHPLDFFDFVVFFFF